MSFNPLKEKGIPVEKQLRNWHQVVQKPFNKNEVDCYSRTRQILMNGIEVEAWNFKHTFGRFCPDLDDCKLIARTRRIEDAQQTTVNWLTPCDQSVLETTLGYEQVAVDLTAWLAQNEPDEYVKETFNFGLLEDFDHLYRYSQWAYMVHGINPNYILQGQTDVVMSRPTQNHHNCNAMRLRKHYDKATADPQTKVNILTLVAGEQQTHNYYAEHGMCYGNDVLRKTYAEIKDVEEEHVSMYESLIDPTESMYEKLLLHEFTEVCTYYNCYEDEENEHLKKIWEMFLYFELEHLRIASELFKKYEKRDPEEVVGTKIVLPCRFESQKEYVTNILYNEIDKRIMPEGAYTTIKKLPEDWVSYDIQEKQGEAGSPTENTLRHIILNKGRDIVKADDKLKKDEVKLLKKGLEERSMAPDTLMPDELEEAIELHEETEETRKETKYIG
ncbi:MAG: hypothetical protein NC408_09440 [Candidatus Gastranaerophilales bacterium]|nr:hypothetical protein [Candidatus Gastranaerophilales bacterium]